jgi:hypothetical protein
MKRGSGSIVRGLNIMALALALQCAKSVEIALTWKMNTNVT